MRLSLGVLVLFFVGCAATLPAPTSLPFPSRPELTWYQGPDGGLCLSPDDADRLLKFDDRLRAFEHAWQRLGE